MSYENRRRGATSLAHVLDMLTRVCHDFFFFLYHIVFLSFLSPLHVNFYCFD